MKRYLPLLVVSFLVILIITGTTFLIGHAGKENKNSLPTITIYTTLPIDQVDALAQEYERTVKVKVNITPLTEKELFTKLIEESAASQADIILANRKTLKQARNSALLVPYQSEYTDIIPNKFQDTDGYWTGVWYDPVIFAANQDYLKTSAKKPTKWSELPTDSKQRLGLTDFPAADAAANLLFTLVAANGEEKTMDFLRKIHPQVVQYSKYLATPARMACMGEVDVAISIHSEALRYVNDGFPLEIIYPEDGTAFLLTGVGLVRGSAHPAEAKNFIDWLTQNEAVSVMAEHKFYYMPTNPEIQMYRAYVAKNIQLLDHHDMYTAEQQHTILDKWVQTRLGIK